MIGRTASCKAKSAPRPLRRWAWWAPCHPAARVTRRRRRLVRHRLDGHRHGSQELLGPPASFIARRCSPRLPTGPGGSATRCDWSHPGARVPQTSVPYRRQPVGYANPWKPCAGKWGAPESGPENTMSTDQRVAVVIGGASGIGWATAQLLAADGCRVTIADRNAELAPNAPPPSASHTPRWPSRSPTEQRHLALFDDRVPAGRTPGRRGELRRVQRLRDHRPGRRTVSARWSTSASPAPSWSSSTPVDIWAMADRWCLDVLNARQPAIGM